MVLECRENTSYFSRETADWVTFIEEIFNGKLNFLYNVLHALYIIYEDFGEKNKTANVRKSPLAIFKSNQH